MQNKQNGKLLDALPDVLQRVRDLARVCDLEQSSFDAAWLAVEQVLAEQFAAKCSDYGLKRWEKLLKITPRQGAEQDERMRTVLFRLNEQLPFTLSKLETLLDLVAPTDGYSIELDYAAREMVVQVSLVCKPVARLISEVLMRTVPANILWELYWDYNKHCQMAARTHGALAAKTHYQIREEVFA